MISAGIRKPREAREAGMGAGASEGATATAIASRGATGAALSTADRAGELGGTAAAAARGVADAGFSTVGFGDEFAGLASAAGGGTGSRNFDPDCVMESGASTGAEVDCTRCRPRGPGGASRARIVGSPCKDQSAGKQRRPVCGSGPSDSLIRPGRTVR